MLQPRRSPVALAALAAIIAPPFAAARRRAGRALAVSAALAPILATACGRQVQGPPPSARLGAEAEWTWLQQEKGRLDAKRNQLDVLPLPVPAPLDDRRAPAGPAPASHLAAIAPGASAAPPVPSAPTARDRLTREVADETAELDRRLVAYINADPPLEGVPLTARQQAAIRMKSDEEIAVAHEFIRRAGDYRRAGEILEGALAGDPHYGRLRDELAQARAAQYMTAERFALATPGMSAEQVAAALGRPNAHDIRGYPGKGVVGWFYPRDPHDPRDPRGPADAAAAAVWFELRDGRSTVYQCEWNALPAAGAPAASAGVQPPPLPVPAPTSKSPATADDDGN